MKRQKVLIIVGPTSSDKSALAVSLAQKFEGEVISADSRQVYRGLDIGTGKITKREMKGVVHHLLDVASPKRTFSAHDYVIHGTRAIEQVMRRRKLPIICGGTGLYIDALTGRTMLPDVPANPRLRAQLGEKSVIELFATLKKRDPRRAKTIEPHHKRRLTRALEIVAALGRVPDNRDFVNPDFDTLWIGLAPPIKELERKITIRLFARLRQGFGGQARIRGGMIEEAKRLHAHGLSYKRMEELGLEYRSLASLLQGEMTRAQMTQELERGIRKYAKRQLRYWKRNKEITWLRPSQRQKVVKLVRNWLKK